MARGRTTGTAHQLIVLHGFSRLAELTERPTPTFVQFAINWAIRAAMG